MEPEELLGLGVEKLKIAAYADQGRTDRIGVFVAQFNPEGLHRRYSIEYGKNQALDSSGRPLKYAWSEPSDLNITLILDDTGVDRWGAESLLAWATNQSVAARVKQFLDLAYRMNGQTHEPNYLTLAWGELFEPYRCRLSSVDIRYTRFNRDGSPLRAELDIALMSDALPRDLAHGENKASPDLTHVRVVKAGDTLPLLAMEIYGSAAHYPWVALSNNLDGFRRLTPGQTLKFPPLPAPAP